jgi:hypothetical protein
MFRCIQAISSVILLLGGETALAQPEIRVSNGMQQPIYLWSRARSVNKWDVPRLVPRQGDILFPLRANGDYYLVVRDLGGNEDHLDWVDLWKLATKAPGVPLIMTGGMVAEQQLRSSNVIEYKAVHKAATKSVEELIRTVDENGNVRYERRVRQIPYTITEYVPVTTVCTEVVCVMRFRVTAYVAYKGKLVPLAEFLADEPQAMPPPSSVPVPAPAPMPAPPSKKPN